jgi:hypothetical protein
MHIFDFWWNDAIQYAFMKELYMIELIGYQKAAEHCGLRDGYFRWLCKSGNGPDSIRPSPKRVFFQRDAIDAWMKTWIRKNAIHQHKVGTADHVNRPVGA